jgi:hypothetical protein
VKRSIAGFGFARAIVTLLAIAALVALVGCGDSSGRGAGSSTVSNPVSTTTAASASSATKFTVAPRNEPYLRFGREAPADEREAASRVLERDLRARQAGRWAIQCASLSAFAIKQLREELGGSDCAVMLSADSQPLKKTAAVRADNLPGPIDVLRAEGSRAYALFRGTDGDDYAMKMEREPDGQWKVGALVAIDLSPGGASGGA